MADIESKKATEGVAEKSETEKIKEEIKSIKSRRQGLLKELDESKKLDLPSNEKIKKWGDLNAEIKKLNERERVIRGGLILLTEKQAESSISNIGKKAEEVGVDGADKISSEAVEKIDDIVESVKSPEEDGIESGDHNINVGSEDFKSELQAMKKELKNLDKIGKTPESELINRENAIRDFENKIKTIEGQEENIKNELAGDHNPELINMVREKIHSWNVADSQDHFNNQRQIQEAIKACREDLSKKITESGETNIEKAGDSKQNKTKEKEVKQTSSIASDLEKIKNTDKALEILKNEEINKGISQITNILIENPGKSMEEVLKGEEILAIVEGLAEKSGLSVEDVKEKLKEEEGKIEAQARVELLKSKSKLSKVAKIVLTMAGGALAVGAAGALGVGAMAAVGVVGGLKMLEKYSSDKKDEKEIKNKVAAKKRELDTGNFSKKIAESMFVAKDKQISGDFLERSESEQESAIVKFVNSKYEHLSDEEREKIVEKTKILLSAEKSNKKLAEKIGEKKISFLAKIYDSTLGKFDKLARGTATQKALHGTMMTAFFMGASCSGLGAITSYLGGAMLGRAGGKWLEGKIKKKYETSEVNVAEVDRATESLSAVYSKYQEIISNTEGLGEEDVENISQQENLLNEEINKSQELLASYEYRLSSGQITSPSEIISLKESVLNLKNLLFISKGVEAAGSINNRIEEMIKKSEDIDKINRKRAIASQLIGAGVGVVASFAILQPGLKWLNETGGKGMKNIFGGGSEAEIGVAGAGHLESASSESGSVDINQDIELGADQSIEQIRDMGVNTDSLSEGVLDRLSSIEGGVSKAVTLEHGDGVSKIFGGHMSNEYSVKFVDAGTGEITEGAAFSKVVHPGDQVILGEDGDVYVICDNGVRDNPLYGMETSNVAEAPSEARVEDFGEEFLKPIKPIEGYVVHSPRESVVGETSTLDSDNISDLNTVSAEEGSSTADNLEWKVPSLEENVGSEVVVNVEGEGQEASIIMNEDQAGDIKSIVKEGDNYKVTSNSGETTIFKPSTEVEGYYELDESSTVELTTSNPEIVDSAISSGGIEKISFGEFEYTIDKDLNKITSAYGEVISFKDSPINLSDVNSENIKINPIIDGGGNIARYDVVANGKTIIFEPTLDSNNNIVYSYDNEGALAGASEGVATPEGEVGNARQEESMPVDSAQEQSSTEVDKPGVENIIGTTENLEGNMKSVQDVFGEKTSPGKIKDLFGDMSGDIDKVGGRNSALTPFSPKQFELHMSGGEKVMVEIDISNQEITVGGYERGRMDGVEVPIEGDGLVSAEKLQAALKTWLNKE